MARIKENNLSGKLGAIVGVDRPGTPYVRVAAKRRKKPATEGEKINQYIFKLVQHWIHHIKDFVRVGFRNYSPRFEGMNAAISQIHREALHREGYDSYIDPSLVKVSHGSLGLPSSMEAALNEQQHVVFNWDTGIGRNKSPRDRVMLLAYNIEAECAVYDLSGAKRHEGSDRLSLAGAPAGTYHCYAAFVAADGGRQSESRYLGDCEI